MGKFGDEFEHFPLSFSLSLFQTQAQNVCECVSVSVCVRVFLGGVDVISGSVLKGVKWRMMCDAFNSKNHLMKLYSTNRMHSKLRELNQILSFSIIACFCQQHLINSFQLIFFTRKITFLTRLVTLSLLYVKNMFQRQNKNLILL